MREITDEVKKVIIGKDEVVDMVFTANSCEDKFKAHVLIFQACAVAYQCC